jgi:hypothetical protein
MNNTFDGTHYKINYIKDKLTPEEMAYFTEISSMLRTGDVK